MGSGLMKETASSWLRIQNLLCINAFVEDTMCKTRFPFLRKLQPIWRGMIYMHRKSLQIEIILKCQVQAISDQKRELRIYFSGQGRLPGSGRP